MFKNRDKVFYYDFNEFKNFEKKLTNQFEKDVNIRRIVRKTDIMFRHRSLGHFNNFNFSFNHPLQTAQEIGHSWNTHRSAVI